MVLLNNDTVVEPNWLGSLVQCFNQSRAGMISSKMVSYYDRKKLDNIGHFMLNTGEILPIGHGEDVEKYTSSMNHMGACAGACLYSTEMLQRIGFFDPYFDTGYEDAELGLRAVIAGFQSIYCPEAVVYHKMGQSIKKIFNQDYSTYIQSSILYTYFKLMPRWSLFINLPFVLLRMAILVILFLVTFQWKNLRIHFDACEKLWADRLVIRDKRRTFYQSPHDFISARELQRKMNFFLGYDLKRFYRIYFQKQKSGLDTYG